MDPSGEVADLLVKEGLQATEVAAKLAAEGIKNAAALIAALAKADYKVVGSTTAKKLAQDPTPSVVVPLKREDIPKFKKLANGREFGVLYCIAQKRHSKSEWVSVVSTQSYAAQLNAIMESLGYPIPEKGEQSPKKAKSRAPQENNSSERGSGLNRSRTTNEEQKPSVRGRLAVLQAAAKAGRDHAPVREKSQER